MFRVTFDAWSKGAHVYLSTSCLHEKHENRQDLHEHCAGTVGTCGDKHPATCKWCDAKCQCPRHELDAVRGPAASPQKMHLDG